MPRTRKEPLPQIRDWINGHETVGEIVLQMAEQLVEDRMQNMNALALTDLARRRAEAVRQIDVAFSYRVQEEQRFINIRTAPKPKRQAKVIETSAKVKRCVDALTKTKRPVTSKTIDQEWSRQNLGNPVSIYTIRRHLKKLKVAMT